MSNNYTDETFKAFSKRESHYSFAPGEDEMKIGIGLSELKSSFQILASWLNGSLDRKLTVVDTIPIAFWLAEAARFEEIYNICLGLCLPSLADSHDMNNWHRYHLLINEWSDLSSITSDGIISAPASKMVPIPAATSSMFIPDPTYPGCDHPRTVCAIWASRESDEVTPESTYPGITHPRHIAAAWEITGSFSVLTESTDLREESHGEVSYGAITSDITATGGASAEYSGSCPFYNTMSEPHSFFHDEESEKDI